MPAYAAAIEALADRVRGFVRDPSCRLLQIIAEPQLRKGALATVMAAEHAPENAAAFVAFDQPYLSDAPGWSVRAQSARQQHDARCEDADPPIAALPVAPASDDGLVAFAEQVWQLLDRRPPGSEGLVVVLAPLRIEASKAWAADVARLVLGPSLAAVRFVVVDVETSSIAPVVAKLGDAAAVHDTRVPEGAAAHGIARRLSNRPGAAPRDVEPPPRSDGPAAGVEMTSDARRSVLIGDKVIAAALAMGIGDAVGAVTAQREARDLCQAAGWTDQAVQMELVLGGQLMAAGQSDAAEASFGRALDQARVAELPGKVATSGFALGAVRTARGERHRALVAYAEAAVAAERSGEPMLAIEGNRLAGQAAADIKMEPQAITFFTRAVKLAEVTATAEVWRTTAAHAARGLATICRKRRLHDRAAELEVRALRFETRVEIAPLALPEPEPEPEPAPAPAPAPAHVISFADVSIPPPDLLAPPAVATLPPPSSVGDDTLAHTAPPPMFATTPTATPPDFGEGTGMLTLQEIADLHWGGSTKPVDGGARPWTGEEIAILGRAINDALEPEATTMMSFEELAALRGDKAPAPAPAQHAEIEAEPDAPLPGLEPLPADAAPAPPTPPPSKGASFDPDAVTMLSFDDVKRLREAYLREQAKPAKPDDD